MLHFDYVRLSLLAAFVAATAATAAPLATGLAPTTNASAALMVQDFGAVGDGVKDDTLAFQAAIDAAGKLVPGRSVRVAPGTYRITAPLALGSTLLIGSESGGWPADSRPLPTILVDVPAPLPTILAGLGASIHGLSFDFDYSKDKAREFGPAIQLVGGGVSIVNVLIHQPTYGIVADGTVNCGRVNLQNVFIVNARRIGVRFEYGLDIITMNNVEVWNYLPELLETTTGFLIGAADEIRFTNCAVIGAAIGFHFIATKLPNGQISRAWGGMDNCTVDYTGTGILIDTVKVLRITGGSFWTHHYGMVIAGEGDVLVGTAEFRSNSNQCLMVKGGDSLTVTGSSFKKNPGWELEPKVIIAGGKLVNLTGNTFDKNSAGIVLEPGISRIGMTGNVFEQSDYPSIIDRAPNARKLIESNLTGDR